MKSKKRANAKGKGKEKAVEMEEVESEDEISGEEDHITQQRDTSARNRRAKKHADDTDEHMTSGYETSQPPPPSRSPSPLSPSDCQGFTPNVLWIKFSIFIIR